MLKFYKEYGKINILLKDLQKNTESQTKQKIF